MRRSVFGKVLQVQLVLGSTLGPLHFPQSDQRANAHRNAEQLALNGVLGELGITGHTSCPLNDIEASEGGHRGHVPAPADDTEVTLGIEISVAGGRQCGLEVSQRLGQAFQVVGVGIRNNVQILSAADEPVRSDGNTAYHHELDTMAVKRSEQRAKVELGHRGLAAPWIALSCLQRACTRASRSLIGVRRSVSRRISRARLRSSISPLNALSAMRTSLAALPVFVALFLALWAPAAQATYDPIGSGSTKLTLDASFLSFLKQNGIALSAKAGAKHKGKAVSLPVIAGNVDPTLGKGEIDNEGTVTFTARGKSVPLRKVTVKAKRDVLTAKVGGSQLKVATSSKLSSARKGFGTAFTAKQLKLTAKVVTRLNKKLRPETPFQEGQVIGTLTTNAQPKLITILEQGRASVVLDPAFMTKMDSLFVSINPIFPAEHPSGPTFTFPMIPGGAISPAGTEGTLRTGGSLEFLQLGAGQVFQHEFWLDLATRGDTAEVDVQPTPTFPGKLGRVGAYDIGPGAVSSDPRARTIGLSGAPLTLTAQTAQTFNEAFAEGKAAFGAGEALGAVSFVAQAQ